MGASTIWEWDRRIALVLEVLTGVGALIVWEWDRWIAHTLEVLTRLWRTPIFPVAGGPFWRWPMPSGVGVSTEAEKCPVVTRSPSR